MQIYNCTTLCTSVKTKILHKCNIDIASLQAQMTLQSDKAN